MKDSKDARSNTAKKRRRIIDLYKNALIFLLGLLLPIGILYPKDLFEEISGRLQKTVKKVSLQNGLTLIMMKRTASLLLPYISSSKPVL